LVFLPYPLLRVAVQYWGNRRCKRYSIIGVFPVPPTLKFPTQITGVERMKISGYYGRIKYYVQSSLLHIKGEWQEDFSKYTHRNESIIFIFEIKSLTMFIAEVIQELEKFAPLSTAEDFDNVGLLVGDPSEKLTGILITLDTLEEVVDEAIEKNCNFILSFHPIIFSGLKKITGQSYVERAVVKAIKKQYCDLCHPYRPG
jgi:hypothetical protein